MSGLGRTSVYLITVHLAILISSSYEEVVDFSSPLIRVRRSLHKHESPGLNNSHDTTSNELEYVGSLVMKRIAKGRSFSPQQKVTKDYYVNAASSSFRKAYSECKNLLGENGDLVNIESIEEWETLKIFLRSYGIDVFYWTGGVYNGDKFIWSSTGEEVDESWAPWDEGEPYVAPTGGQDETQRITIAYRSRFDAGWISSRRDSTPQKFICQILT